jgi:hypothetical protein
VLLGLRGRSVRKWVSVLTLETRRGDFWIVGGRSVDEREDECLARRGRRRDRRGTTARAETCAGVPAVLRVLRARRCRDPAGAVIHPGHRAVVGRARLISGNRPNYGVGGVIAVGGARVKPSRVC